MTRTAKRAALLIVPGAAAIVLSNQVPALNDAAHYFFGFYVGSMLTTWRQKEAQEKRK